MIHALLMLSIHLFILIYLKTLRFKSFVLFETHTLLDNSLIVLKLPAIKTNSKLMVVKLLAVFIKKQINKGG